MLRKAAKVEKAPAKAQLLPRLKDFYYRKIEKWDSKRIPEIVMVRKLEEEAAQWERRGHNFQAAEMWKEAGKNLSYVIGKKGREIYKTQFRQDLEKAKRLYFAEIGMFGALADDYKGIAECESMLGNSDVSKSYHHFSVLLEKKGEEKYKIGRDRALKARGILNNLYNKNLEKAIEEMNGFIRMAGEDDQLHEKYVKWGIDVLSAYYKEEPGHGMSKDQFREMLKTRTTHLHRFSKIKINNLDDLVQQAFLTGDMEKARSATKEVLGLASKMLDDKALSACEMVLLQIDVYEKLLNRDLEGALKEAVGLIKITDESKHHSQEAKKWLRNKFSAFAYTNDVRESGFQLEDVREEVKRALPALFVDLLKEDEKAGYKVELGQMTYHISEARSGLSNQESGVHWTNQYSHDPFSSAIAELKEALQIAFFLQDSQRGEILLKIKGILENYANTVENNDKHNKEEITAAAKTSLDITLAN